MTGTKRRGPLRAAVRTAVLALALAPLGGCAISLFSTDKTEATDAERLAEMERRLDEIERRMPQR